MGLYEVGAQVGGRLGSKRGLVLGLGHRSRVIRAQVLGFGLRAQLERRGAPSASRSIDAVSAGLVHLCREQSPQLGVQSASLHSTYTGPHSLSGGVWE